MTTSCEVRRKKASQGRRQWLGQSGNLRELEDRPSLLEEAARVVLRQSERSRKLNSEGGGGRGRLTSLDGRCDVGVDAFRVLAWEVVTVPLPRQAEELVPAGVRRFDRQRCLSEVRC